MIVTARLPVHARDYRRGNRAAHAWAESGHAPDSAAQMFGQDAQTSADRIRARRRARLQARVLVRRSAGGLRGLSKLAASARRQDHRRRPARRAGRRGERQGPARRAQLDRRHVRLAAGGRHGDRPRRLLPGGTRRSHPRRPESHRARSAHYPADLGSTARARQRSRVMHLWRNKPCGTCGPFTLSAPFCWRSRQLRLRRRCSCLRVRLPFR